MKIKNIFILVVLKVNYHCTDCCTTIYPYIATGSTSLLITYVTSR